LVRPPKGAFFIMAGQPTRYRQEFDEQAERLCKLGFTDIELGEFFGVKEATINNWKKAHREFFLSIKRGKDLADSNVADKLYQRATGYEHPDVDIKCYEGQIIETPLIKHYPPDTAAAIFWLKNRQRKKWRDKVEMEHSGEMGIIWQETKNYGADGKTNEGS